MEHALELWEKKRRVNRTMDAPSGQSLTSFLSPRNEPQVLDLRYRPSLPHPLYTSTSLVTPINISINSMSRKQSCRNVIMIEKMIRLIIDNWYRSRKFVFRTVIMLDLLKVILHFPYSWLYSALNDSEQRVIIVGWKSMNSSALSSDRGT